jgi:hypothetical protein
VSTILFFSTLLSQIAQSRQAGLCVNIFPEGLVNL